MDYSPQKLKKLENILKDSGIVLRYEKGSFSAGYCILKDRNMVLVNKYYTPDVKFQKLLEIISVVDIDKQKLSENLASFYESVIKSSVPVLFDE